MDHRVARRYAKALYRVASQSNMVANVEGDLNGVVSLLQSDAKFRALLFSPQFARDAKERVLEKAFADSVTGVTMEALRLLLRKRRETELLAMREEFINIRRNEGQVLYATVHTAEPISDEHKSQLIAKLEKETGKKVEAEFEVSPNLIGGIRVGYDNFVLDGSIRGGLNRLRDSLRRDLLKQA